MPGVSAVVAVRDEASQLVGCLKRLAFADEIVVVIDDRTIDDSAAIAAAAGARVIHHHFDGFAGLKNAGLDAVTSEWVLVVDGDERVGPSLAAEIQSVLSQDVDGFRIPRVNYFYGHKMRFGGWKESHIRMIRRGAARYAGDLHETFSFVSPSPRLATISAPLHHFTHRSVIDNLHKTAVYSDVYANERLRDGAPAIGSSRLYFTVLREVVYRLVIKQGWRDGVPGVIECLYQPLSVMSTRIRLWELQQVPSIEERYRQLEDDIE
jgi:glycosyltransferase involved in cell wall biosynthesis